jgi:hypothetical protein
MPSDGLIIHARIYCFYWKRLSCLIREIIKLSRKLVNAGFFFWVQTKFLQFYLSSIQLAKECFTFLNLTTSLTLMFLQRRTFSDDFGRSCIPAIFVCCVIFMCGWMPFGGQGVLPDVIFSELILNQKDHSP